MSKLKASTEFSIGNHSIGWINSDFKSRFGDTEFEPVSGMPTFQKLPRAMNDAEIESELKPGLCTLGDVLAFMDNPPEGTKDGYWNLFYTESFVVLVHWDSGRGEWRVITWARHDDGWGSDERVFSPATVISETKNSELGSFETLNLDSIKEIRSVAVTAVLANKEEYLFHENRWYKGV